MKGRLLPLLVVLGLAACGRAPERPPAGRDALLAATWDCNVLIVLLDAARADHFGALGYGRPTTPNIDAFAAEAVIFEEAFAQATGTATSVYSFFTSRYPVFEKVPKLVGENAILVPEEATTLLEGLAPRLPHRLVLSTNAFVREYLGLTQGATRVIEDWRPDPRLARGEPPRYADRVTAPALEWIDAVHEEGFAAYLHYLEPHQPYHPPEPWLSAFARDAPRPELGQTEMLGRLNTGRQPHPKIQNAVVDLYDGNLAWVDDHFGRLMDGLREKGLLDETIVVVISDHGEGFWERGWRGHGTEPYQELLHVPFMIRIPGLAGRRIAGPVELVDLMPTLLELTGVPLDALDLVGESLVDAILQGRADPEGLVHARSNRTEDPVYALRQGRWKWLFRVDDNREELYDLAEDPIELADLVAAGDAPPEMLEEFRQKFRQWIEEGRTTGEGAAPVDNLSLDPSMIEALKSLGYID